MATTKNISGSPAPMKLGGHSYIMHPLDDRDYGEFEHWMRAQPIEIARESMNRVKGLTQAQQDVMLGKAMEISAMLSIGSPEAAKYMSSVNGAGYLLWLGLRKHTGQESLTHQQVVALLMDDRTIQEAMDKFDMINGIPQLKPTKKGGQRKMNKKLQDAVNSAIGKPFADASTDSSPKNTGGMQTPSPE